MNNNTGPIGSPHAAPIGSSHAEKLVHTLLESQRGQIFISEHLFGKPKETIDSNVNINNFDIKDIVRIK